MDSSSPTAPLARSPLFPPGGRSSSFFTYEPYYGLNEKPFSLSADPRFLYKSPSHAATFDDLLLGIRRREGLIVLTGDIGTGKTTLCRAVLDQLDRKTFSTFIPDPFVSREDLLRMLLIDFGVMSVDELKRGRLSGATRPDLSYPLYEFLKSLLPLQAFAVLVIDEAQNLSPALLEEIRILSDLEAPEKLLQVVLVGQLEFRSKLKLPEMRQLDQRVSVRCNLEPLQRDGVASYIAHRLKVAGGGLDRVEFSPDAATMVFEASGGVPRLINLICDRALYRGYLSRAVRIGADTVALAATDLGVGDLTPTPAAISHALGAVRRGRGTVFRTRRRARRRHRTSSRLERTARTFLRRNPGALPNGCRGINICRRDKQRRHAIEESAKDRRPAWGEHVGESDGGARTNRFVKIPMVIFGHRARRQCSQNPASCTSTLSSTKSRGSLPRLPHRRCVMSRGPMTPAVPSTDAQAPPAAAAPAVLGDDGYTIDVAMFAERPESWTPCGAADRRGLPNLLGRDGPRRARTSLCRDGRRLPRPGRRRIGSGAHPADPRTCRRPDYRGPVQIPRSVTRNRVNISEWTRDRQAR